MLNSGANAAFDQLQGEHIALARQYGAVQKQCSQLLQSQRADIARLEAEMMRLRAAVLLRDTALAAAHEDRAALEASIPGLPRRAVLARRVDALLARIQLLMRERLHWQFHGRSSVDDKSAIGNEARGDIAVIAAEVHRKSVLCLGDAAHTSLTRRVVEMAGGALLPHALAETALDPGDHDDLAALEASLVAADLVICQTGCLSHGAYWRVQDHCKRTGKTCVMLDQPHVIRIVRGIDASV
jgi:hypothetical protein